VSFLATATMLALVATANASERHATSATVDHAMHTMRPEVITLCTQGSFTDAMATMNAAVKSSTLLQRVPGKDAAIARAELHSILAIALKRSAVEYACAKMQRSYASDYAHIMQSALRLAKAERLAPSSIAAGMVVLEQLAGE
jgi:hypothetical protein